MTKTELLACIDPADVLTIGVHPIRNNGIRLLTINTPAAMRVCARLGYRGGIKVRKDGTRIRAGEAPHGRYHITVTQLTPEGEVKP